MLTIAKDSKRFVLFAASLSVVMTFLMLVFWLTFLASSKSVIITSNNRLVCYYTVPDPYDAEGLRLSGIDAHLCTHINIGPIAIKNSTLTLSEHVKQLLENEMLYVRSQNKDLKFLLWIGGVDVIGYPHMIAKHDNRKAFIRSLLEIMHLYKLDGVDLDWEFPSAYNKERMHFSQLLYEIRKEFKRAKREYYLLSVAVAAVEGIAEFAYDIRELNLYTDFVNLMAYDYHMYSHLTPFTGLNAPLFARDGENSILSTFNINYSINWWLSQGIDRDKLVVGLPTYGHSFTLVNPFNNKINAPAENIGMCGEKGFTTYSDVCWFKTHNVGIQNFYDPQAESPYFSSGIEWISYENETSVAAKANFIISLNLGGIMAFSLNSDDIFGYCLSGDKHTAFPLIRTIKKQQIKKYF